MEEMLTLRIALLAVLVFCSVGDQATGQAGRGDTGGRSIQMWMIPGDSRIDQRILNEEFAIFRRTQTPSDLLPEDRTAGANEFLLALSEARETDVPGMILRDQSRILDPDLGPDSEPSYASLTENGWLCLVPPRGLGGVQCSRELISGTVFLALSSTKRGVRAYGLAADRVSEVVFSAQERKWRAFPRANAFIAVLEPTDSVDDLEVRLANGETRTVKLGVDLRQVDALTGSS
jgi:hypothetical protein